jgi:intracellular septation protein A
VENVDASPDSKQAAGNGRAVSDRLRPIAKVLIVDVAAPLATYYGLRSAGLSAVTALVLSGVFPAASLAVGAIRHRRIDAVGALVLAGIVVGAILGLALHSARPVLLEGSVPTAVFGVACLGSLATRRPLMFGIAHEFVGPESAQGREMTRLWQYEGYQRVFRTITAAWGVGFVLEAALRVVVVFTASTGTATAVSNATPYIWAGVLCAWTVGYGTYRKRKSERLYGDLTNDAESASLPG